MRQLARFFDMKRETLLSLASMQRPNPTVVLLTPGPHNETYFEHSFWPDSGDLRSSRAPILLFWIVACI